MNCSYELMKYYNPHNFNNDKVNIVKLWVPTQEISCENTVKKQFNCKSIFMSYNESMFISNYYSKKNYFNTYTINKISDINNNMENKVIKMNYKLLFSIDNHIII